MPRYELLQKRKQERQVWRELPPGSRVVIYGRHSPGEKQSIHSQADAMRRFIHEREWVALREFYDEAVEGSRSDRDGFQEMLTYLQQIPRPVEGVVTWNTSRFGRDQLDSQFYKADLRRRGYVVFGKEDGIEQSPLAPVLESMLEWKAQQDLAVISADTKRGLEYLARQGFWPGGPLPKGYVGERELIGARKNGDPRFGIRIRQDPAISARVTRAWEMRLAGASYRAIHDEVQLYRSTKCYSTFFDNILYTGILAYGGQRYPEGWRDGARFCEPYVSLEQFERLRAQAEAYGRRMLPGPERTSRNRASTFLLSGLVVCGRCLEERSEEVTLIGWHDPRRSSGDCYRCGRKVRLRGESCSLRYVSCRLLERTVIEQIRDQVLTPDYLREEVARANEILAQHGSDRQRQIQHAEAAEARARKALERLGGFIAAHGSNPVIEEQYRAADSAWRLATAELSEAKQVRRRFKPLTVTEVEAKRYAQELVTHMYDGDIEVRRKFIAAIIRRIVLNDEDGMIELVGSPALQALRTVTGQPRAPTLKVDHHLWDSAPLGVPSKGMYECPSLHGEGRFRPPPFTIPSAVLSAPSAGASVSSITPSSS
jgi:DNA invertase Pin-like site-specific DNA recombinase